MKSFLGFFSSVKLAVFLLIAVTLASILGTLVPQNRAPAEYAARYGALSQWLMRLEITNLYHSRWYLGLLFLFGMNTLICTTVRLPAKLKRAFGPPPEEERGKIRAMSLSAGIRLKGPPDRALAKLQTDLRRRRFSVSRAGGKEGGWRLRARKRRLGFFGSDIAHFGILIILIGGIVSGLAGTRRMLKLKEGETVKVPGADFLLRLDRFTTEYYENGSVRDWKSRLSVLEGGREVLTRTIEVNHPLSHGGFLFYQSSYGWDWENPLLEIEVSDPGRPDSSRRVRLVPGEKILVPGFDVELEALRFFPDFFIDENRRAASRSPQPNNPAVYLECRKSEERIFSGWVFARYPDFGGVHERAAGSPVFRFKDIKPASYSGIEMARDPGASWIWLGSTFLMLGLLAAFYWPPLEIRVLLEPAGENTELSAAVVAAKNRDAAERVFERITMSWRMDS